MKDDGSEDATPFDEVIFKLVDHLAAEEKVTEEGKEDEIEEEEEEGEEGEEGGLVGYEDVTKGSGREYEVGFRYDPSANNKEEEENDDDSSSEDDSDDEDSIFSKGMRNAADSEDEED